MSQRTYSVVEVFSTIQGEGKWAGRAAVFLRFAGCNMWSGRPEDRSKGSGACAMWCDTDFAKGTKQSIAEVLTRLQGAWETTSRSESNKMVVISGGEPTLQLDDELAKALAHEGWFTAIETNGTVDNPSLELIDHVCVSPKRGSLLKVWGAHELKVVIPGAVPGAPPELHWSEEELISLQKNGEWGALYVQPQDVTDQSTVELTALTHARQMRHHVMGSLGAMELYRANVQLCVDWVKAHPSWRLSLQTHKYIGAR